MRDINVLLAFSLFISISHYMAYIYGDLFLFVAVRFMNEASNTFTEVGACI